MPPTNLTTPFQLHPAAKQLDGQMQPTSLPSSLTGTSHVLSTPPYATKQLDNTVRTSNPAAQPTAEFPPPSSLTVRGSSPADRAQVDCNHWSQQLPTHESPCHAPGKQSQSPDNVRTRHNRTRRLTRSHTNFSPQTPEREDPTRSNLQRGSHATITQVLGCLDTPNKSLRNNTCVVTCATLMNRLPGSRVLRAR